MSTNFVIGQRVTIAKRLNRIDGPATVKAIGHAQRAGEFAVSPEGSPSLTIWVRADDITPTPTKATAVKIIAKNGTTLVECEVYGSMAYFDAWLAENQQWQRDPQGWHCYVCGEGHRFYVIPAF